MGGVGRGRLCPGAGLHRLDLERARLRRRASGGAPARDQGDAALRPGTVALAPRLPLIDVGPGVGIADNQAIGRVEEEAAGVGRECPRPIETGGAVLLNTWDRCRSARSFAGGVAGGTVQTPMAVRIVEIDLDVRYAGIGVAIV